ncbi:MAG: glycosyltransferase family protein [Marinilabiliaceae bacterium]
MKILYAIQGTGNGHLARAIDLVPEFEKYADVDVLLSGRHSELKLPFPVKYQLQGFGFFFGSEGGIDWAKTLRKNSPGKFLSEVASLPVRDYDLVISDFEPVSSWACRLRGKKCFGMSHQAAVVESSIPVSLFKNIAGKGIMRSYAPVTASIGFHFRSMGTNISTPVIRKKIRQVVPENQGHYTVYLPAFSDVNILKVLAEFPRIKWHVFSKYTRNPYSFQNIRVRPVDEGAFIESLAGSEGVLCHSSFETPAEALFLGKKLCVVPMKNQYEQYCNAAMLESMGIPVLESFSAAASEKIGIWLAADHSLSVDYPDNVEEVVQKMLGLAMEHGALPVYDESSLLAGA